MKNVKAFLERILMPFLIAATIMLTGCVSASNPITTLGFNQVPQATQPDQFYLITRDGVEIACPKNWQTYSSDSSLLYGVCRGETIRIITGVLPAASPDFYDDMAAQGTVFRTIISGNVAYRNDYAYTWDGHELTNICVTMIKGDKACHFMFLCDTSILSTYQPIFDYVLNSLKFL